MITCKKISDLNQVTKYAVLSELVSSVHTGLHLVLYKHSFHQNPFAVSSCWSQKIVPLLTTFCNKSAFSGFG